MYEFLGWENPQQRVRAIRQKLKLTQNDFADQYGFKRRTVQEWERGVRKPTSTAKAYLTVIEQSPVVVFNILATGQVIKY